MPWSVLDVQSAQQTGGNTVQLPAFAVNPAAGDVIHVFQSNWNSTAKALLTPTDTIGGNTYTQLGSQLAPSANVRLARFRCPVVNGGATFRITCSSTSSTAEGSGQAWLLRHSAGTPAYNSDIKDNTQISEPNPNSGTTTPAPAAGGLFTACMTNLGTEAVTNGSGWNAIANGFTSGMNTSARLTDNATHQDLYVQYLLSDSAVDAAWTATDDDWSVHAASDSKADSGAAFLARKNRPIGQAVHRSNSW